MKTYKEQQQEIKRLMTNIDTKTKNFAEMEQSSIWFEDLNKIISDLKEIDSYLPDSKYL